MSMTSSNVSIITSPPTFPAPTEPPVGFVLFDPAQLSPTKPQPTSENLGKSHLCKGYMSLIKIDLIVRKSGF